MTEHASKEMGDSREIENGNLVSERHIELTRELLQALEQRDDFIHAHGSIYPPKGLSPEQQDDFEGIEQRFMAAREQFETNVPDKAAVVVALRSEGDEIGAMSVAKMFQVNELPPEV